MKTTRSLLAGILVLTSSCTSLSKEDCQNMNWHEKGKADGMNGKSTVEFSDYRSECSKHGIIPNQNEYAKGRSKGLESFCTYDNGYQAGLNGDSYGGVCPDTSEKEFLRGFNLGQREHQIKQKEEELAQREAELSAKKAEYARRASSTCTFDSDCNQRVSCTFNKCGGTGTACTFDSDCEVKGRCESQSEFIDGTLVQINICKYN